MTVLLFLVIALVFIRLWNDVGALRERLRLLNGELDQQRQTVTVTLEELVKRVERLEGGHAPSPAAAVAATAIPSATPPQRAFVPPVTMPAPSVKTPVAPSAAPPPVVAVPSPAVSRPAPPMRPALDLPTVTRVDATHPPVAAPEGWEVVVGTNWLNKLGVVVLVIGLALAITGTVTYLAGTTSTLLLGVFATVHTVLIVVKRRGDEDAEAFQVPIAVPVLGLESCVGLALFIERASLLSAGALIACGLVVVAARSRYVTADAAKAFEE